MSVKETSRDLPTFSPKNEQEGKLQTRDGICNLKVGLLLGVAFSCFLIAMGGLIASFHFKNYFSMAAITAGVSGATGLTFLAYALYVVKKGNKEERPAAQKIATPEEKKPPPSKSEGSFLLSFYLEEGKNDCGVTFQEILNYTDGQLESKHDFIQRLFPLQDEIASPPHPSNKELEMIKSSSKGQERAMLAFTTMLRFYGLVYHQNSKTVEKGENWEARKTNWLTSCNHNYLRITRILRFLRSMGRGDEALAFLKALLEIKEKDPLGPKIGNSWIYWEEALQ